MSAKLSGLRRGVVDLILLLVPAERKDDADLGGRTRDDASQKVDDDRQSLRFQILNFRSLRWRRSRCGPAEPAGCAA